MVSYKSFDRFAVIWCDAGEQAMLGTAAVTHGRPELDISISRRPTNGRIDALMLFAN